MFESDEYILTLATNGYGKRSSAYEYTVRKRGGQGIGNIDLSSGKDNKVAASFPVISTDQLVLVTDQGQMIRTTVNDIRIAGRSTKGVIVFRVAKNERVVSVSGLGEVDDDDENIEDEEGVAVAAIGTAAGEGAPIVDDAPVVPADDTADDTEDENDA